MMPVVTAFDVRLSGLGWVGLLVHCDGWYVGSADHARRHFEMIHEDVKHVG
jgi:hypothetical protein